MIIWLWLDLYYFHSEARKWNANGSFPLNNSGIKFGHALFYSYQNLFLHNSAVT